MVLRPVSDVSVADWFVGTPGKPLDDLGPAGFEAYVRLPHPVEAPAGPEEFMQVLGHLDDAILHDASEHLARHSETPDECYFGLWDGFGNLDGGDPANFLIAGQSPDWFGRFYGEPKQPTAVAAFPPEIMQGPRVGLDHTRPLDHILFTGPLRDVGQWGAADYALGVPRGGINSPSLMWPADRSWFLNTNLNNYWTAIGGSEALIADLLADDRFEAIRTTYGPHQPEYR